MSKDKRPPSERRERQHEFPDDLDGKTLKHLVKAGADLSEPHDVDFCLDFPNLEGASHARDELTNDGYSGRVDRAAEGTGYCCHATKRIALSYPGMVAIRALMTRLAAEGNGVYDGWGTMA